MLQNFWTHFCNLVYPPNCFICQKHIPNHSPRLLCASCQDLISLNKPPFCLKCSRHLGKNIKHPKCHFCKNTTLHFDFAWSACLYEDPLKTLIHKFKYTQKTHLYPIFSTLIINFIKTYHLDLVQFDLIIPIPLSPTRLRERGYNQSHFLAKDITKEFNIPLVCRNLIRIRNTEHQTLLSKKERWTNISKAFRIINSDNLDGKNVLIIDDLLTTGATASEAAKTLKEAGAKTVGVLTLAITKSP